MLPRMHARRGSFRIALPALLLAAVGCHDKKASGSKSSSSGTVHAQDLKLDMVDTPRSKSGLTAPPQAGTLGITLDELQKRWNEKAPAHNAQKIASWHQQFVPAFQAWRAGAEVGPNLVLEVVGVGKNEVQAAQVSAAPLRKDNLEAMFNAWETLREAATPDISQQQLYKGLGLLSKPTARVRFLDQGGYVWQFTYSPRRPKPEAQVILTVHRSQPTLDPGKPYSMLVRLGNAGEYGSMGSFTLVYSPSSRGKTFQEAAKTCDQQGLVLCTDAQWHAACSQRMTISSLSTWTASFNKDLTKLQTRGGGKDCDSGGPASAADKDPKRGAVCCTRDVAMTGRETAMRGLFAMPVLEYEQAVDQGNKAGLLSTLGKTLTKFYTLDNPARDDAVKFAMDDAAKHPGRWSEAQTCELKSANRKMFFLLDCRKDIFDGDQGMSVLIEYGIHGSRIESLQEQKVLRKLGPM